MPARPKTPLPDRAPVVIIGGGVMGTSAAFHLAEAGLAAVLLERDQLGSGSTSRAAGGVRAQFSDELNIALAQRSLAAFADFARRPGWEIDLQQVGYLFVLTRESDVAAFEHSIALQNEYGVPSRLVSPAEAKQLCPLLDVDDVLAATFSPQDGHATPEAVVQGYANAARARGAILRVGCAVLDIATSSTGTITSVVTDQGAIATDTVVCAAGAWSREIAAMVGVDLPVTPLRRQVLFTEAIAGLPQGLPMTIDFATSFYFHGEGPGLLMGMSHSTERPGYNLETSDAWLDELFAVVRHRAPSIADVGIRGGWAGLYEMTPDHNAVIGEASDVSRFVYATGFSGHGFLQGPAVGEIVRDIVLGRTPFIDVAPLGVERFRNDRLRPEFNVV